MLKKPEAFPKSLFVLDFVEVVQNQKAANEREPLNNNRKQRLMYESPEPIHDPKYSRDTVIAGLRKVQHFRKGGLLSYGDH